MLTTELIQDLDLNDCGDADDWKFIVRDEYHTEHGYQYSTVYQEQATGEYWAYNSWWNSWTGDGEISSEPYLVTPTQVQITRFVNAAGHTVADL
jgi:hypothetical protein